MPSVSEKQRRFMGMQLGKLRAGEPTDTGMTEQQLRDFAKKPIAKKKRPSAATQKAAF
jgi:hypothetical protein